MNKTIYRVVSVIMTLAMALSGFNNVAASGISSPELAAITYFVSMAGSDTNNCTQQTLPCRSFNKAMSLAQAGDVIHIIGTIPSIRVTKSGIIVEGGIVDGIANRTQDSPALGVAANNITIRNMEVINGWSYGIRTDAGYGGLLLENVIIHNSVLENKLSGGGCDTSNTSGWGSGFRAYYANNVVMRNSKIYDNCGEGFSSVMSSNVTGTGLEIYDNFSVNVYPDQSQNFTVTDSVISCVKPEYQRFGLSVSLLLGAENYSGMTTNTTDGVTFERNKVYNCKGTRTYSETTNVWKNIRIANNEFYNVPSPAVASISGTNIVTSPNTISSSTTIATATQTKIPATATPSKTPSPVVATKTNTFTPVPVIPTMTQTVSLPAATSTLPPLLITASATSQLPSSETTFDNKDSAFIYSSGWKTVSTSKAYKGSYRETTYNNATAKFVFTGQSFSILYKGGMTFSKFDVYVDEILVSTLNQKLTATTYQSRWDYPGQLAFGPHTLKLVFKVTSATINRGSLDAIIVRSAAQTSLLQISTLTSTQIASPTFILPTATPTSTEVILPTPTLPIATQTVIPPSIVPSETPLPESPTPAPTSIP